MPAVAKYLWRAPRSTQIAVPVIVGNDIVGSVESVVASVSELIPEGEGLYIIGSGAARYQKRFSGVAAASGSRRLCLSQGPTRSSDGYSILKRTTGPGTRKCTRLYLSGVPPGLHPYYLKPSDAEVKWKSVAIQT
jgi:hypothetical protein